MVSLGDVVNAFLTAGVFVALEGEITTLQGEIDVIDITLG
jgi:hypothetical protein